MPLKVWKVIVIFLLFSYSEFEIFILLLPNVIFVSNFSQLTQSLVKCRHVLAHLWSVHWARCFSHIEGWPVFRALLPREATLGLSGRDHLAEERAGALLPLTFVLGFQGVVEGVDHKKLQGCPKVRYEKTASYQQVFLS